MRAIILAAGVGKRLKALTSDPKCLIEINGEPLIIRSLRLLNKYGIYDITVVVGYRAGKIIDAIRKHGIRVKIVINRSYDEGSVLSLWAAKDAIKGDLLLMDGDIYFEERLVRKAVSSRKKDFFLIDTSAKKDKEAVIVGFKRGRAVKLQRGLRGRYDTSGEWAGVLKASAGLSRAIRSLCRKKINDGQREAGYEFIIPDLFGKHRISCEPIGGIRWVEIDFPEDLKRAKDLICQPLNY